MLTWNEFEKLASSCRSCRLCEKRNSVVIGRGSRETGRILFVGEGPGENEDREGIPFVGQAGRLFDFALEALEFPEVVYYIANVVKCRPPQNRDPAQDGHAARDRDAQAHRDSAAHSDPARDLNAPGDEPAVLS